MAYNIGSFNIRDFNFSNESSDGERLQRNYEKIAKIIRDNFDIVGVQEVNSEQAVKHLTDVLNRSRNLLCEWEYRYSGQASKSSKDPEGYAFIWNSKKFRLLDVPKNNNPRWYEDAGGASLVRRPYYARFTARGMSGGSNFELRLLNIHIKFGTMEERRRESDILLKQVLPRCCDQQGVSLIGEVMPSYTFVLGDYNLKLSDQSKSLFCIKSITPTDYTGRNRYFKTVQEMPTSLKKPDEVGDVNDCYSENYDHFSYELNLVQKMRLNDRRIEGLNYYKDQDTVRKMLEEYRREISDHVPICLKMDLKR